MSEKRICSVYLIQNGHQVTVFTSTDVIKSCLFGLSLFKDINERCSVVVELTISEGVIKNVLELER